MNKIEKFVHQLTEYEIRSLPLTDGWHAAVFVKNKQVSPRFFVSHENDLDCASYTGERGLDALFQIIKHEITGGRIKG